METFQEIIHRYMGLRDKLHLHRAYEALEEMVSSVTEVRKDDTDRARALCDQYQRLSSRDCLHVAVMKRLGCRKIWTYDSGFDEVPTMERIQ